MRWSKLKSLVEARFAPSLRGRVALHCTHHAGDPRYGNAWITVDGAVMANLCSEAWINAGRGDPARGPTEPQARRYAGQWVGYGEFERDHLNRACWAVIHELRHDEALRASCPLVRALAVLDGRLGRRRMAGVLEAEVHPLPRNLLLTRMHAEGLVPA